MTSTVTTVYLISSILFQSINLFDTLDIRQCNKPLGMESGRIKDEQITASSVFDDQSTSPKYSRLNSEDGSGAWCPLYQINETSHEYLQIEFSEDLVISGIETQGRYDKGRGMEYPTGYMIEYYRTSLQRWARYKDYRGNEIIDGNSDTITPIFRELDGVIIAKIIRIIPVSQLTRTVCMRIEVYGCNSRSSLVSYTAPIGSRYDGLDLRDINYDGDILDNGLLINGLGKLFDGIIGDDNFEKYPEKWLGWNKNLIKKDSIILEFNFNERKNFSSILLHVSNNHKLLSSIFKKCKIYFSTSNDDLYSTRIIKFEQIQDNSSNVSRWIKIFLNYRLAKKNKN